MTNAIWIEHALLVVRDLDVTLAWYRHLLPDWTVRWDGRPRGTRWGHFGPPDHGPASDRQPSYLSLCEHASRGPARDDPAAVRILHVGFAHPDVAGLIARLSAVGIKPSDRADDGEYRRVYFVDPDGHQLEFVQRL